jgi:hypothetical protein
MFVGTIATMPSVSANISSYPYTIFGLNSVNINAYGMNLNGHIASNGSITVPDSFNQINKLTENADEGMMYIGNKIINEHFSDNADVHDNDFSLENLNINIANPIQVNGNLSLFGGHINPASNLAIMATNDILLICETINANNNVIYSKQGDIEIQFPGTASLQGLIYAPHGDVTISAQGVNLNGVVIIAKNVTINSQQNANVNHSGIMAMFVGFESEICYICNPVYSGIDCRLGSAIAPPSSPNNTNFINGNSADGSRASLNIDVLELIAGTSVKANRIHGIEVVTWGNNTENRQVTIEVNGVASPRFHGASAPHADRIWAIMEHGNPISSHGRTQTQTLRYMNIYGSASNILDNIVTINPFVSEEVPSSFDVRIRANDNHASLVMSVAFLDRMGEVLGVAAYSPQYGNWSEFVSAVVCGECDNCIENDSPGILDIGEIYFKGMVSEDCIDTDENGIDFVKNQFLLTAHDGVSYAQIEMLADEYESEIVGFIELTNCFQLEMIYDVDSGEIHQIIDELTANSLVEFVSLNIVSTSEPCSMPNDPWSNVDEPYGVCWDTNKMFHIKPDTGERLDRHRNWGVKAIDAPGAWAYREQMQTVKIGLIDSMFQDHVDLDYFQIWNNWYVWDDTFSRGDRSHGNHVAGIMAAGFDTYHGITGIIPYNKLYAYSVQGGITDPHLLNKMFTPIMELKYALALMIGNDVKVINYSQAQERLTHDSTEQIRQINDGAENLGLFLNKLINVGYDFVIVAAAGNNYERDAGLASFLNRIEIESVRNRVIVVGGIGLNNDNEDSLYNLLVEWNTDGTPNWGSRIGDRIDVVAPGEKIYSTMLNNSYGNEVFEDGRGIPPRNASGTSYAAPHVAGIVGMMYSVNPALSGEQIKNIIVETAEIDNRVVYDSFGQGYYIANAKLAVERAIAEKGDNIDNLTINVRDFVDEYVLNNATIRIQNDTVDMYLTNGVPTAVLPGWYTVTVRVAGYITYHYRISHGRNQSITISLVKDERDVNGNPLTGKLTVDVTDRINSQFIAYAEVALHTFIENDNGVFVETEVGKYTADSNGEIVAILPPGYYFPVSNCRSNLFVPPIFQVYGNGDVRRRYLTIGLAEPTDIFVFNIALHRQGAAHDFNSLLWAFPATISEFTNYMYSHLDPQNRTIYFMFHTSARESEELSLGFYLSDEQVTNISEFSDDDFAIMIMAYNYNYGTGENPPPIWITARQLIGGLNEELFVEFANISFNADTGDYEVSSNFWLIN